MVCHPKWLPNLSVLKPTSLQSPMPWGFPYLSDLSTTSPSPLSPHSSRTGLLADDQTHHSCSHLRVFALAVPSALNTLPQVIDVVGNLTPFRAILKCLFLCLLYLKYLPHHFKHLPCFLFSPYSFCYLIPCIFYFLLLFTIRPYHRLECKFHKGMNVCSTLVAALSPVLE